MGSLAHWASKLGYVLIFQTGNLLKLGEALYKYVFGFSQGDIKARGDVTILVANFISYCIGAAISASVVRYNIGSSVPLFLTFPFQLYFAGCYEKWGWFKFSIIDIILPTISEDNSKIGEELKPSDVIQSPLGRETFDIESTDSQSNRSDQNMNVIKTTAASIDYSNNLSRFTRSTGWISSVRNSLRRSVMDQVTRQEYLDSVKLRYESSDM